MSEDKVEFPSHERPTTDVSMLGVCALAAFITFGIFFTISFFKGTFIRDLLMGRYEIIMDRVVFQSFTVFMWSLSTANVILKIFKLRKERAILKLDLLPSDLDMKDTPRLIEVYKKIIAHPQLTKRVTLARMARVLAMWINTQDFERSEQYARQESEMDIFVSDSSFRANRLFIWAMPLLGFVGTVYGVSYGIGGFADFLKGQVTAEGIKDQVGLITQGLAVAFFCTLLGLCCAGLAAFPSLGAERTEEELLEEINQLTENRLVSRMPSVRKTEFPVEHFVAMRQGIENMKLNCPVGEMVEGMKGMMESLQASVGQMHLNFPIGELVEGMSGTMATLQNSMEHMKFNTQLPVAELKEALTSSMKMQFPVEELAKAIQEGMGRMPDPAKYEEIFTKAAVGAAAAVNEKYQEFAQMYETRIGELGALLASKLDGIAERFSAGAMSVAQQMSVHSEHVTSVSESQRDQFAAAHQQYLAAHTQLTEKELSYWQNMVSDFRSMATEMAQQLNHAVMQINEAADHYSLRVDNSAKALVDQIVRVVDVGTQIDHMLQTTRAMETALLKLGSSEEFGATLAQLREHLAASDEIVKKASRPRTIVFEEART